jgi:hypothetical protein
MNNYCFVSSNLFYRASSQYTLTYIPGSIQNIPDWCRLLYTYKNCGSAKHRSQKAKLWTPTSTATFCGDYVKTCEDVSPNFGKKDLDASPWQRPVSCFRSDETLNGCHPPTHRTPLIWHPASSSYFQKWNCSWKDAGLIPLRRSRPNRRECLTFWQKRTSRKRSKNGEGRTGVYMREGPPSKVMAANRPYGEFYDYYSVRPENVWYTLASIATKRQYFHRLSLADMVHRPAKILYRTRRNVPRSAFLMKHSAWKTFGRTEAQLHVFWTSAIYKKSRLRTQMVVYTVNSFRYTQGGKLCGPNKGSGYLYGPSLCYYKGW